MAASVLQSACHSFYLSRSWEGLERIVGLDIGQCFSKILTEIKELSLINVQCSWILKLRPCCIKVKGSH